MSTVANQRNEALSSVNQFDEQRKDQTMLKTVDFDDEGKRRVKYSESGKASQ